MSKPPAASDAILSASELVLAYGGAALLDGATLAIGEGEKVGLVGRNGSGKSSFLRILAGEERPDGGSVSRRAGLMVGHLPQEFDLDEGRDVWHNVLAGAGELLDKIRRFEGMAGQGSGDVGQLQAEIDAHDGWNLEGRAEALMRQLGAPAGERRVGDLSGGEKRRVGLCRALLGRPDLLILDEPTNHLDAEAISWLEGYLAGEVGSCIFVTHDRYFLDRIATRIVELSGGRFYSHPGNYSDYLVAKAERQEREEAAEKGRQRFLRREVEWVRAGIKARGTKQRSRLDAYYATKAEAAPERELDMELVLPPAPRLGKVVVDLEGVRAEVGDGIVLFEGFDISFRAGECVGVVGPNGAGKTTLLRILMGQLAPAAGSVEIGARTEFNYADQTRLELDEDKSVYDEVAGGVDVVRFGAETLSVRAYLRRFLFADERINDRIGNLSGGEKNRVLLAKILRRGGNFLVLDEPTNDLDLPSLRVLEEALVNFGGTGLVVSHDRWFLDRVCDRILVFDGRGGVELSEGNYSYFLEKKAQRAARQEVGREAGGGDEKRGRDRRERARKLSYKETQELAGIEGAILAAEGRVEELQGKLQDPDFAVEHWNELGELGEELERRRGAVVALYARWEELEAVRAALEGG
jgi:ATPase subunit of ABC transporter with duplicated ATPase domains